jgi:hypothetical protein
MTCDAALDFMLDAELSELTTDAPTLLGAHLRDCGRCRRVAWQLVHDTRLIAHDDVLPIAREARPGRRALVYVPAAIAAGAVALLARQQAEPPVGQFATMPAAVVAGQPLTDVPDEPTVTPVARMAKVPALRAYPAAQPIAAVELPRQVAAATPVALVASNAVSVTPPAGTRAVVMQTSDPRLVVVWLYDPEEHR